MSILKPLVWKDSDICSHIKASARSPLHGYFVSQTSDTDEVSAGYYENGGKTTRYATGFATIDEAKQWAWNHYNEKMQPYFKQDSAQRIENWFKKAKPEPTSKDKSTQLGCVVEEFAELMESAGLHGTARELVEIADMLKEFTPHYAAKFISRINKVEALDAISDITVTVQGFNNLMGFDGFGALNEVIRSNDSKMVNGKFEFDANGKIMKPNSFSEPDLTPFVGWR